MRTIIGLGLAATYCVASAQCGITMSLTGSFQCPGPGSTLALNINGGVPPLSVVLQQFGQPNDVINGVGTPVQLSVGYLLVPEDGYVTVAVTDATGCTAQANLSYQRMIYVQPVLTTTYACSTGTAVRWNGQITNGAQPFTSLCPSTFSYSLSQTGTFPPLVPLTTGWTQESPTSWLYGSPLPQGNNLVVIAPGAFERACLSLTECYGPKTVTVISNAGDCGINLRLRASLDGALPSGTIMTDALRSANLIPTTEPYTALGFTFVGSSAGVTIAPTLLAVTGNDAIVDWVVVELRSNTTTVVYSKPALLQADGDVIDTDGNAYLNFPITAGNYYVAMRHRNHQGIMTATSRTLGIDPAPASSLVDFRVSITSTYGTNGRVQKGTVWCLWAGDANGDGSLKYTGSTNDRDPMLIAVGSTTPNNTVPNVYDRRDTNLDGVIKYTGTANDRDIILTNVGSTTPNNTRLQQLP